ncbi:hypothetical protein IYC_02264 [Clostridium sporogenes PA 3679]|uniref:hypothetical protein n=1 Tax=Clostridium sporogenes TaxID=1509 RepID=UPI00024BABDE|nr:hypothetical protein [Clostridium sporogenes]EHN16775.1 hypothetical protein IYC_02264 [Clostridium sporogenes PA 3679]MCW6106502.1 hypothetical protein [Clostridium sporogenes]
MWDDTVFIDDNMIIVNVTRIKNKISELEAKNMIVKIIKNYLKKSSIKGFFLF